MRLVLGFFILGVLFCVYWFGVAALLRQPPKGDALQNAQVAQISVSGFPRRFAITLDQPALPAQGWSAPWLRADVPVYWPFSATGTLPGAQTLRFRGTDWSSTGPDMWFAGRTDFSLTLHAAHLEGQSLRVAGAGLTATLGPFKLALTPGDTPTTRRLRLTLSSLELAALSVPVSDVQMEMAISFDRTPDLRGNARIRAIGLDGTRFDWGNTRIAASGTLTPRDDGRLDGAITLEITGWSRVLDRLQTMGLLPPDQVPMLRMMAQNMSADERLILPLTLSGSVLGLGPLALLDLGRF